MRLINGFESDLFPMYLKWKEDKTHNKFYYIKLSEKWTFLVVFAFYRDHND